MVSENLLNIATGKVTEIEGDDIVAKSSENYMSGKIGCLKFLGSCSFLAGKLDELSATITSFPSLDPKGMTAELFQKQLAYPSENLQTIESF